MLGHSLPPSRELARTWRAVLGRLELEVSGPNFETWLADTRALSRSGIELVVEASSSFRADWLNDNLLTIVDRSAATIVGEGISVRFVAPGTNEAGHRPESAAVETASTAPETIGKVDRALTLARYFRADGNALAILSCLNLIDAPETAISPVLVHGAPGLGKTHLLHGLASCAEERGWRVACLTGEGFLSRYQRSLRDGSSEAFQDAIRGVRLLIVDDLQDLAGKRATQRELLHTLDAVTHAGGVAALGSEIRPRELGLPERLRSRLEAGVVARIEPFAPGERQAFVARRASELRVGLPNWCVEQIARPPAGSVRSTLAAVHAAIGLQRRGLLDEIRLAAELGAIELSGRDEDTVEAVLERVAAHYAINAAEVVGRSRAGTATQARAIAAAALQARGRSYSEIGALLGGRNRSTIKGLAERGRALGQSDASVGALLETG